MMSSFGNNHCLGLIAGNNCIRFTAADVFLRRYGFYIEIEALDGHAFISSLSAHRWRPSKLCSWRLCY
jgi:hypothetical protein